MRGKGGGNFACRRWNGRRYRRSIAEDKNTSKLPYSISKKHIYSTTIIKLSLIVTNKRVE